MKMLALLSQPDILVSFLRADQHQEAVGILELLCRCSKEARRKFFSFASLRILCQCTDIPLTYSSSPHAFLKQYNHRHRRECSRVVEDTYHLLWAIKEYDQQIIHEMIAKKQIRGLTSVGRHPWFDIFVEIGKRRDYDLCLMLSTVPTVVESNVPWLVAYCCGLVSVFGDISVYLKQLNSCQDHHLALLLYEASRNDNLDAVDIIKDLISNKSLIEHTLVLAIVASDNLDKFRQLGVCLWESRSGVTVEEIPIVETGFGRAFVNITISSGFTEVTYEHELIMFAKHYGSFKILNHLYSSDHRQLFGSYEKAHSVEEYRWMEENTDLKDKQRIYIRDEAIFDDNLDLVIELKELVSAETVKNAIDRLVYKNCYKVIEWMLETFGIGDSYATWFMGVHNTTVRVIQDHLKKQ